MNALSEPAWSKVAKLSSYYGRRESLRPWVGRRLPSSVEVQDGVELLEYTPRRRNATVENTLVAEYIVKAGEDMFLAFLENARTDPNVLAEVGRLLETLNPVVCQKASTYHRPHVRRVVAGRLEELDPLLQKNLGLLLVEDIDVYTRALLASKTREKEVLRRLLLCPEEQVRKRASQRAHELGFFLKPRKRKPEVIQLDFTELSKYLVGAALGRPAWGTVGQNKNTGNDASWHDQVISSRLLAWGIGSDLPPLTGFEEANAEFRSLLNLAQSKLAEDIHVLVWDLDDILLRTTIDALRDGHDEGDILSKISAELSLIWYESKTINFNKEQSWLFRGAEEQWGKETLPTTCSPSDLDAKYNNLLKAWFKVLNEECTQRLNTKGITHVPVTKSVYLTPTQVKELGITCGMDENILQKNVRALGNLTLNRYYLGVTVRAEYITKNCISVTQRTLVPVDYIIGMGGAGLGYTTNGSSEDREVVLPSLEKISSITIETYAQVRMNTRIAEIVLRSTFSDDASTLDKLSRPLPRQRKKAAEKV